MAKLTDRQRKQIIAEYVDGKSQREIAKSYHVSQSAIAKLLNTDKSVQKLSKNLTEQNEKTVMEWIGYRQSKGSRKEEGVIT